MKWDDSGAPFDAPVSIPLGQHPPRLGAPARMHGLMGQIGWYG